MSRGGVLLAWRLFGRVSAPLVRAILWQISLSESVALASRRVVPRVGWFWKSDRKKEQDLVLSSSVQVLHVSSIRCLFVLELRI